MPTGTELTAEEEIELLSVADVVARPARSERRRGLIPAVIGLGAAALIGVGVTVAINASGDPTADATKHEATPSAKASPHDDASAQVAAREVVTPAPPAALVVDPPEPEPEPELALEIEPAPEIELALGSVEPPASPERPVATATPRVPVEFVANEFFFVYVKVGGKVLTLEPRARLELPEGKHTVYLRQSPDAEWARAGRINIEPGSEYRVEMRKPASLKLVKK